MIFARINVFFGGINLTLALVHATEGKPGMAMAALLAGTVCSFIGFGAPS